MSRANERQVGGEHYKGVDYEHWDWICDIRLHYLLACASKYVTRSRNKNGRQDLEKAVHYIEKAEEKGITGSIEMRRAEYFWRFVLENALTLQEAEICWYLMEGQFKQARVALFELLETVE